MIEHEINKLNNFICGWYSDNTNICDEIIRCFKNSQLKFDGCFVTDRNIIDHSFKKSLDCPLYHINKTTSYDFINTYVNPCLDEYTSKYPYVNEYSPWNITQSPNIQYYSPGDAFYGWHCERTGMAPLMSSRHLVFMTYLNDVTDGGETHFYHQNIKIKPEKGLTLVWPVDWTFTHRGIPSPTQEKYIVTGWLNYTN